ncbi:hypothetical protein I6H43_03800 [Aeromonas jandaei]|uniref:glucose-1-phosphate thymidylyltransferase n=1 Tax=Aeromonas jandaei TaxID=650 RepID=A0A7T4DPG7_AERJA|nr:hypothetical protein I6H43_03800 [Aeromonas jandaei]
MYYNRLCLPRADLERYGVVEFDKEGTTISLEEKPLKRKNNYTVTGLYFYDNSVVDSAKSLKPSFCGDADQLRVLANT